MSMCGDFDIEITITKPQIEAMMRDKRRHDAITDACNVALAACNPPGRARNRVRHLIYIEWLENGKWKAAGYKRVYLKVPRAEKGVEFDQVVELGQKPEPRTGILSVAP